VSAALRRRAWRAVLGAAAGCLLLTANPVLATSPSPSSAPSPSVSATARGTVSPSPAASSAAPSRASAGQPASPSAAAGGQPAWPGAAASGSPAARPSGSAAGPSPAEDPGQTQAARPASGTGSGQSGTSPDFCPQLNLRPLSGCQALPEPVRGAELAPTGAPLLVGLIGLALLVAGWLVYRRSRKAPSPESQPSEEGLPKPPADAHG
jgi:hypothetical protein